MKQVLIFIILVLSAGVFGCKKHTEPATSAHRLVLTADPYLPIMQQETEKYMSLYPQAKMEVLGTSTREAVVHLLNDSVRSIMIDRQFNEEERQVVHQISVKIVEDKIAEDGVAIIVNKQNPLVHIAAESIRRIVTGAATDWKQILESHWSGPIDFVLTGRNSGMYELLQNTLCSSQKTLAPTSIKDDQRNIILYVSEQPFAVGSVAASLVVGHGEKIKVLPVIIKSQEGNEEDCFPGQQEIHNTLYPFHYSLYLYSVGTPNAVGVGFSAFVLSNIGQKIIQKAGLVPASIPYRTIQLNAE